MAKIYALDPIVPFDYILQSQRDDSPQDQIIWKLKPLTAREAAFIEDNSSTMAGGEWKLTAGTENILSLHIGLVDVLNFTDREGRAIPVKRKGDVVFGIYKPLDDEFLDRLPPAVRVEIASAIRRSAKMESQDKKN